MRFWRFRERARAAVEEDFLRQMEEMCRKLYCAGRNTDDFPASFVVREGTLYYADYECSSYSGQWDFQNWGSQYWRKSPAFLEHFHR